MTTLAVTRLTLLELRHSKLVVLPLTVAVALALVAANVSDASLYGDGLLRGAWTALGFCGALVGVLGASGLIASEIERGTMLLLATRPVSRASIVLGKALGVALYLVACAAVWGVVLAIGLGRNVDAGPWVAAGGAMVAVAPMLLGAVVALCASAVFPTRGAIGATLALFLTAIIVAGISPAVVKPENRGRVELAQDALGWVLPSGRLGELPHVLLGDDVPAGSWIALVVLGSWVVAAAVLLSVRRSLAR